MRDIIAEDEESGQIDALKASSRDTQKQQQHLCPFCRSAEPTSECWRALRFAKRHGTG